MKNILSPILISLVAIISFNSYAADNKSCDPNVPPPCYSIADDGKCKQKCGCNIQSGGGFTKTRCTDGGGHFSGCIATENPC